MAPNAGHSRTIPVAKSPSDQQSGDRFSVTPAALRSLCALDSAVSIDTRSGKMEVSMVEIQPIRVEIEREDDGRILASVTDLPGVMLTAVRKTRPSERS